MPAGLLINQLTVINLDVAKEHLTDCFSADRTSETMTPSPHALAVLLLTFIALILFSRKEIPLETSALIVLIVLVSGFHFFPYEDAAGRFNPLQFFEGFANQALIAVCALMIAGQALVRTGSLELVGRLMAKIWAVSPSMSFLATLVVGALLSAFINNTPIVILLIPILINVCNKNKMSPTKIMMPMNFATLLGGMTTTIGTSTNLLVVAVAADMGVKQFSMFDFFLPACVVAAICIFYLWLIAPKLLPEHLISSEEESSRLFTAHFQIGADSESVGKTLSELINVTGGRMQVQRIRRSDTVTVVSLPDARVRAGDRLLVDDTPQNLKEFEQLIDAKMYSGGEEVDDDHPLKQQEAQLAEVLVYPGSPLHRSTLNEANFFMYNNLEILAIHRAGKSIRAMPQGIANARLRMGDILLMQGPPDAIDTLKEQQEFVVLDNTRDLPYTRKARIALILMGAIILAAATGIMPIHFAAPVGVCLMLLTKCLSWKDITQSLSPQIIFIIVTSLALGKALLATGGSEFIATSFVHMTGSFTPIMVLGALMFMMMILTNVVSNNAAAVIGAPIAISIATTLNQPPEPFILAVIFGANMSFVTPMAYQTNLLVMNAGGYQFEDFVKTGSLLALIAWASATWVLAVMYNIT